MQGCMQVLRNNILQKIHINLNQIIFLSTDRVSHQIQTFDLIKEHFSAFLQRLVWCCLSRVQVFGPPDSLLACTLTEFSQVNFQITKADIIKARDPGSPAHKGKCKISFIIGRHNTKKRPIRLIRPAKGIDKYAKIFTPDHICSTCSSRNILKKLSVVSLESVHSRPS